MALIDLSTNISSVLDRNDSTLGIPLDLSKAFDTIDHKKTATLWYLGLCFVVDHSYLEDRTQFVQFGSHRSYDRKISCGVPQGSILTPLLSNIYINDLPKVFSLTQSLLFADDTNIFCSHRNTDHLVSIASNELAKIFTWLKRNPPSSSSFPHPREEKINVNVPFVMENTLKKQVVETNISFYYWSAPFLQISYQFLFLKKISKTVRVIAQARLYLSSKTLQALYYSLVYPYLTYCNVAWSSTYCSSLNFIYVLQKRILRLIAKAHYLGNTAPLFGQLKALDTNSIYLILFLFLHLCIRITIIFRLVTSF